ncbi:reverse transcriptase domain-containing protein [Tanacetum coccineum]
MPRDFIKLCWGFGYDSSTDDYKVIVGFGEGNHRTRFHVLTLKSNIWKLIGDIKYKLKFPSDYRPGILCKGSLHWFMNDRKNNKVIISFDLSLEEFNEIPQPHDLLYNYEEHNILGFIESLCIYDAGPRSICVISFCYTTSVGIRAEVPVKMPPRRNRPLTEAYEQEFNRGSEGEELENPFFDSDGSSSDEQPDRPRRNQMEDNRRWESGMRVNIPEFDGNTLNLKGFFDWLVAVEEVFEFKDVPENKGVSLIATQLRGRASAWWQQLKLTRERIGNPRGTMSVKDYRTEFYQLIARNDIQETDDQLVSRYIGGLRVQIMDSVNMFDPVTLSDAYQRALAFEKHNL